ncbi:MAG: pyridoxamine 5'-phosphate oxidase family protein [Pseudonocardia sp.]|nr:pyridoxamine 5'-phosphate oxidase family protein [Pseudonocardia sp.]
MTAEHRYTRPEESRAAGLPEWLAGYLDGSDLLDKTQAARISTVDIDGWPHATLLSAGDMVALPPDRLRLLIYPQSTTTANLTRDGRLALTLSVDGGMGEVRLRARRLDPPPEVDLAMFEAIAESVRFHRAPYADVTTGVTFAVHDPETVLARWERQVDAMRATP